MAQVSPQHMGVAHGGNLGQRLECSRRADENGAPAEDVDLQGQKVLGRSQ